MDNQTPVDWANFIQDLFKQWVYDNYDNVQLSGDIEIDESFFGRHCKYHRGNPHVGLKVWIFGLVERETNRLLLFPVDQRDTATLIPIITQHVRQGSRIFSDGWAAYRELNDRGYQHFSVNHKVGFKKTYVNVLSGEEIEVHTNTIEGCWKHNKQHFRHINGTSLGNFEAHLAEIMWRNWNKTHIYAAFFNLLKTDYTLEGPPQLDFVTPLFLSWSPVVRQRPQNSFVQRLDSSEEALPISGEQREPRGAKGGQSPDDSDSSLDLPNPSATSTPAIPSGLPAYVTVRRKPPPASPASATSTPPIPSGLPAYVTVRRKPTPARQAARQQLSLRQPPPSAALTHPSLPSTAPAAVPQSRRTTLS